MSNKDQEEEKEVVLKLSFSKQKDLSTKNQAPQMITEWHYIRIGSVLLILLVLLALGIGFFLLDDVSTATKKNPTTKQTEKIDTGISYSAIAPTDSYSNKETQPTVLIDQPTTTQTANNTDEPILGTVVRAQLAKGIWQNEPFRLITGPIKVNSEEATGIFYFTEFENMKDQNIFHIWRYKGEIIFKKQKHVNEDRWQTYTSKLFTKRSIGSWSVETVDSNNRLLNLINFDVVSQ